MKLLIVFLFSLMAFNIYAAEEGENKKTDCPFIDQSSKREAKVVAPVEIEIKKDAQSSNVSK